MIPILRTKGWSQALPVLCRFHDFICRLSYSGSRCRSEWTKYKPLWAMFWILLQSIPIVFQIIRFHMQWHIYILVWLPIGWRIRLISLQTIVCNISPEHSLLRLLDIHSSSRCVLEFSFYSQPPKCWFSALWVRGLQNYN